MSERLTDAVDLRRYRIVRRRLFGFRSDEIAMIVLVPLTVAGTALCAYAGWCKLVKDIGTAVEGAFRDD